jgi:hypothetical protein
MFNQELSNLKLNEKLKMKIYIFLKFKAYNILFQKIIKIMLNNNLFVWLQLLFFNKENIKFIKSNGFTVKLCLRTK